MTTESTNKKGFWDFCCEHPIATFFIAVVLLGGIADIASSITGHYEHDNDGFWSDGCKTGKGP